MSDLICVSNRALCEEDFLLRIEKLAAARPAAIILREKDLSAAAYRELAASVLRICREQGTPCILHGFAAVAASLGCPALHLPLAQLRTLSAAEKAQFSMLGASCHSLEEAQEAERLGCSYVTAGHIFATDCKRGLPGRGLNFLSQVCAGVSLPVYAIGGISAENIAAVRAAGAAGACVMSGAMRCADVPAYLSAFDVQGEIK